MTPDPLRGWSTEELLADIEERYGPGIAGVARRYIYDPREMPRRKHIPDTIPLSDPVVVQFRRPKRKVK